MTDIPSEINVSVRTPYKRPSRAAPASELKLRKRYALAGEIMLKFCEEGGFSPDSMRVRSQKPQDVARRRKYARLCKAAGIGRTIIGHMLHLDGSTVAAYLDPGIIRAKVLRKRARALARKSVAAGAISVPIISVP